MVASVGLRNFSPFSISVKKSKDQDIPGYGTSPKIHLKQNIMHFI